MPIAVALCSISIPALAGDAFQIGQSVPVTIIRLIGYWRSELPAHNYAGMTKRQEEVTAQLREQALRWPDPKDFVDPVWDMNERRRVAEYLEEGTLVNQYRGLSPCRFCGHENGSAEVTDGAFCWPEGLAHYLWDHDVRLPQRFVAHVLSSPDRLRDAPRPVFENWGQRNRSWPGAGLAHMMWAPEEPYDDYGLYVETDPTWWLEQSGIG